ncbi:MAG: hypothetical protein ACXW2E_00105 [Nitrososphaeraceae archaeon]
MSYYIMYNKNNNSLVYIDQYAPTKGLDESLIVEQRDGEIPDLSKMYWADSVLTFLPKNNVELRPIDFISLFTAQERFGIWDAAKTDPIINDILEQLKLTNSVTLMDYRVKQSIQYFVSVNLLTEERAAIFLQE